MLTNKTDDGVNVILHQQFQVKKYQPSFFFNTFVSIISLKFLNTSLTVNLNAILDTVHELVVWASSLKNVPLCVYVRNAERFSLHKHNGNIADVWLIT